MNSSPVRLAKVHQTIVIETMVPALRQCGVEPLTVALGRTQMHLLARFPDHNPRDLLGIAKRTGWNALRLAGYDFPGGIWARSCSVKPIADRRHQVATFWYILDHQNEGDTIWSFDPRALTTPSSKRRGSLLPRRTSTRI